MLLSELTDQKDWKTFSINISLVILLVILGTFIGLFLNNKRLVETGLVLRAQSHFNNILLTRRWNAAYGGVYVEKKLGVVSNPYLKDPDIQTVDGKTYTKKNPALMTREISELALQDKSEVYQFHITSLKTINPANAPDAFERTSLESFEKGAKETITRQQNGDKLYFRYMAPLFVEESCLQCHTGQDYKLGDVRGGISVSFDMTDVKRALDINRYILSALFVATISTLLGIIYLFIKHLMLRLALIQSKIAEMAITDELTELYNRRYFFSKLQVELSRAKRHHYPISCLLIDIDFFKMVNDTYGHPAGDKVLREVAGLLKGSCRISDTIARYGGEEFIQFLPETEAQGAGLLAEKLRALVESHLIQVDSTHQLQITISIGVVSFSAEELAQINTADQIIHPVDLALYQAKKNGRNRVEFG